MRAAAEYYRSVDKGCLFAYAAALRIAKSLELRMWHDTKLPMKQIKNCGRKSVGMCNRL